MKRMLLSLLVLPIVLTGCGSDVIADRVYAQAVGLSRQNGIRMSLQSFDEDSCHTIRADSLSSAFRVAEVQAGGKVFVGHTELICLDGSMTVDALRELFFENGVSPACKVIYAPSGFLHEQDSTPIVHTLRMAERDGLLTETNLAAVMEEWLGEYQTALLPVAASPLPGLMLLHRDGTCTRLHEDAARGMLWLRHPPESASVTIGGQEISVRDIRLEKRFEGTTPLYLLHLRALDCDTGTCRKIQQQLRRDCEAAASLVYQNNADVIGLQALYESADQVLPDRLPEIRITVTVER